MTVIDLTDDLDDLQRDALLDQLAGYQPHNVTDLLELADVVLVNGLPRVIA